MVTEGCQTSKAFLAECTVERRHMASLPSTIFENGRRGGGGGNIGAIRFRVNDSKTTGKSTARAVYTRRGFVWKHRLSFGRVGSARDLLRRTERERYYDSLKIEFRRDRCTIVYSAMGPQRPDYLRVSVSLVFSPFDSHARIPFASRRRKTRFSRGNIRSFRLCERVGGNEKPRPLVKAADRTIYNTLPNNPFRTENL